MPARTRPATTLVVKDVDVDWSYARKYAQKLEAKKRNIVTAGGHALLDAANETVPDDPATGAGDLKSTGFVSVDSEGNVVVGYSARYALRQHEVPYNHQGAGRWKWLELTAKERAAHEEIERAVADEAKEVMS